MSAGLSGWLSLGLLAIAGLCMVAAALPPWDGSSLERRGVVAACAAALALLSSLMGDVPPNPDALFGAYFRIGGIALILVLIVYRQMQASRREMTSAPRTGTSA